MGETPGGTGRAGATQALRGKTSRKCAFSSHGCGVGSRTPGCFRCGFPRLACCSGEPASGLSWATWHSGTGCGPPSPWFSCKLWHPNARGVPAPPRPLPLSRATQPPLPLSPLPTPTPRPAGGPAVQSPGLWTNPTSSARDTAVLLSSPLREPDSLTPILTSRAGQTPSPSPGRGWLPRWPRGYLDPVRANVPD